MIEDMWASKNIQNKGKDIVWKKEVYADPEVLNMGNLKGFKHLRTGMMTLNH